MDQQDTSTSASLPDPGAAYKQLRQIGKGAFGSAFLVEHKETKQKYVLKRIRLAKQSNWQRNSSIQERDLMSRLKHPYIVPHVESWVQQGHTVNIVCGYCEKGDLESHIVKDNYFKEATLALWLAQLLLALDYLQGAGVLHRDIKTSNLLLTAAGDAVLGDFGLATFRRSAAAVSLDGDDDQDTADGPHEDANMVGTPHYMSPELLSRKGYCFKSDVWSLGCVFYELTALRPAFDAFNISGLVTKIQRHKLAPLPDRYSPTWQLIITTMLRKDPAKRPSVQELLAHPALRPAVQIARARALKLQPGIRLPPLLDPIAADAGIATDASDIGREPCTPEAKKRKADVAVAGTPDRALDGSSGSDGAKASVPVCKSADNHNQLADQGGCQDAATRNASADVQADVTGARDCSPVKQKGPVAGKQDAAAVSSAAGGLGARTRSSPLSSRSALSSRARDQRARAAAGGTGGDAASVAARMAGAPAVLAETAARSHSSKDSSSSRSARRGTYTPPTSARQQRSMQTSKIPATAAPSAPSPAPKPPVAPASTTSTPVTNPPTPSTAISSTSTSEAHGSASTALALSPPAPSSSSSPASATTASPAPQLGAAALIKAHVLGLQRSGSASKMCSAPTGSAAAPAAAAAACTPSPAAAVEPKDGAAACTSSWAAAAVPTNGSAAAAAAAAASVHLVATNTAVSGTPDAKRASLSPLQPRLLASALEGPEASTRAHSSCSHSSGGSAAVPADSARGGSSNNSGSPQHCAAKDASCKANFVRRNLHGAASSMVTRAVLAPVALALAQPAVTPEAAGAAAGATTAAAAPDSCNTVPCAPPQPEPACAATAAPKSPGARTAGRAAAAGNTPHAVPVQDAAVVGEAMQSTPVVQLQPAGSIGAAEEEGTPDFWPQAARLVERGQRHAQLEQQPTQPQPQQQQQGATDRSTACSSPAGDEPDAAAGAMQLPNSDRLQLLERVLQMSVELYQRGRWQELGAVLSSPGAASEASIPALRAAAALPGPSAAAPAPVRLGDGVVVGSTHRVGGTIRYCGPVHWDVGGGDYVGIELESRAGKHGGVVAGVRYFDAAPGCAHFVRAARLSVHGGGKQG